MTLVLWVVAAEMAVSFLVGCGAVLSGRYRLAAPQALLWAMSDVLVVALLVYYSLTQSISLEHSIITAIYVGTTRRNLLHVKAGGRDYVLGKSVKQKIIGLTVHVVSSASLLWLLTAGA